MSKAQKTRTRVDSDVVYSFNLFLGVRNCFNRRVQWTARTRLVNRKLLKRKNRIIDRPAALTVVLCALTSWSGFGSAAQSPATLTPARGGQSVSKSEDQPPATNGDAKKESEAERIARLQRRIEETEKILNELRGKLTDPEGEYAKAEAEFKVLDGDLANKKKELQKANDSGIPDVTAGIEKELEDMGPRWQLAKERFDLAIQARKSIQEQVPVYEQKLQQDREALAKLVAPPPPTPQEAKSPAVQPPQDPIPVVADPTPSPIPTEQETTSAPAPAQPTPPQPAAAPQEGALPQPTAVAPPASAPPLPAAEEKTRPPTQELVKAQEEAQKTQAKAQEAEKEVRSVVERTEAIRKTIELELNLLATARKKADNAQEAQRTLSELARKRAAEGASQDELMELWTKSDEAQQRLRDARAEIAMRMDRADDLQGELDRLQADQIAALHEAERQRQAADSARKQVEKLENPLSARNILRWFSEHGPRILGIILGMILLLWGARALNKRIIKMIADRGQQGTPEERQNRAQTLVAVFQNAVSIAIIGGGLLMLLAEVQINIVPLVGGAAVLGLAVAFGAQNLIKDYFYGFMILLENQYGINDVVKIGEVGGLVERVTLRITILRDLEGVVHFVPNGQIATVSNMTHGWSRALFDIGVSYKEDVDRVIEVLIEECKELRRDPQFRGMILESPEMLGVDKLGDSAVMIKFFIKTRPLKQWLVKREMLRRIKKKFDELGIEIPFPHRTVYHRYDGGVPEEGPRAGPRGPIPRQDESIG